MVILYPSKTASIIPYIIYPDNFVQIHQYAYQ